MRATSEMKTAVLSLLVVSASTAVVATTVNYNGISLSDIGPFLAACRANQQGRLSSFSNKVARWQNVISSFPWIAPGWRAGGAIQGKKGFIFCSVA